MSTCTLSTCTLSTLIIGLGNPLRRDDGVGVRVVELLAARDLPAGVEVVDGGTPGLGLVPLLEGRQRVILVDAADLGREPGAFVRFTLDQIRLSPPRPDEATPDEPLDKFETCPTTAPACPPPTSRRDETTPDEPLDKFETCPTTAPARLEGTEAVLSVHDAGLREALQLAEALGVLPAEVILFGVQPARLDWQEGLSPPVEAALPDLVAAILTLTADC